MPPVVTQIFPTVPFTASVAYATDPDFRALVDSWVENRWCPLPLVDRCLELDLPNAAECARWAATEPDRPVLQPHFAGGEVGGSCGPYPTQNNGDDPTEWYWFWDDNYYDGTRGHAHHVPVGTTTEEYPANAHHETRLAAILWFLDNWTVGKS